MTNKIDEQRKWKNVNNQEEMRNYRKKNERNEDKAKKEYLDSMVRQHGISKKGRYF
jgi:hypothetical protein